jgi:putative membrane protein
MKIIAKIALGALALLITAELLPGITITGLYPAIIVAIILGILNTIVRPLLIIITLPVTALTLGMFIFIINASLFYFVSTFVSGFYVDSFLWALLGSIMVSSISVIGNRYL